MRKHRVVFPSIGEMPKLVRALVCVSLSFGFGFEVAYVTASLYRPLQNLVLITQFLQDNVDFIT